MNNAFTTQDVLKEETPKDVSPHLVERVQQLTDVVEALQNIIDSSYWEVLKKYVFDVDLSKARSSLEKEEDTTKMFRLQGEIQARRKLNLEKLLVEKRNELEVTRQKLL